MNWKRLQLCVDKNNEAIAHLTSGNTPDSFECFKQAVEVVRDTITAYREANFSQESSCSSRLRAFGPLDSLPEMTEVVHGVVRLPAHPSRENNQYTYNAMFVLKHLYPAEEEASNGAISTIASAIIFNMALAHQQLGRGTRAIELYGLILRIVRYEDRASFCSMHSLLLTASLNNRSLLYNIARDIQRAREDMDRLAQSIHYVPQGEMMSEFQHEALSGMMVNCLCFNTQPPAASAA